MKNEALSDQLIGDQDQDEDPLQRKVKAKKYKGLLEWILDQDGHEYMVDVDRAFIKDKMNLIGLKEKLAIEFNSKNG